MRTPAGQPPPACACPCPRPACRNAIPMRCALSCCCAGGRLRSSPAATGTGGWTMPSCRRFETGGHDGDARRLDQSAGLYRRGADLSQARQPVGRNRFGAGRLQAGAARTRCRRAPRVNCHRRIGRRGAVQGPGRRICRRLCAQEQRRRSRCRPMDARWAAGTSSVVPDTPPVIAFSAPPSRTERDVGQIRLHRRRRLRHRQGARDHRAA